MTQLREWCDLKEVDQVSPVFPSGAVRLFGDESDQLFGANMLNFGPVYHRNAKSYRD